MRDILGINLEITAAATEKMAAAKAMLAKGFEIKIIIKITGLTEEMILQ